MKFPGRQAGFARALRRVWAAPGASEPRPPLDVAGRCTAASNLASAGSSAAKEGRSARIARNSLSLTIAQLASQGLGLGWMVVLARLLGPDDFGLFVLASTLGGLAVTIADPGITTIGVREVARAPEQVREQLTNALLLRFALATVAMLTVAAFAFAAGYTADERLAIILFSLTLVFEAGRGACTIVFRALQRLSYEAVLLLIFRLFSIGLGVLALCAGLGLEGVIVAYLTGSLMVSVVAFGLLRRLGATPARSDIRRSVLVGLLKQSAPLGVGLVLTTVYYRIDVVLLSNLTDLQETGLYGAAYRALDSLRTVQTPLVLAIFPFLASLAARSPAESSAIARRAINLCLAGTLPIALLASGFGRQLVTLAFGASYSSAGPMLELLMWSLSFVYVNNVLGYLLVAVGMQRAVPINCGAAAAANIGINLVLIPRFGGEGAAAATVMTEALLCGMNVFWLTRAGLLTAEFFGAPLGLGAFAGLARLLISVSAIPPVLSVGVSVCFLAMACIAMKVVRLSDIATVASAIPAPGIFRLGARHVG